MIEHRGKQIFLAPKVTINGLARTAESAQQFGDAGLLITLLKKKICGGVQNALIFPGRDAGFFFHAGILVSAILPDYKIRITHTEGNYHSVSGSLQPLRHTPQGVFCYDGGDKPGNDYDQDRQRIRSGDLPGADTAGRTDTCFRSRSVAVVPRPVIYNPL